MKEVDEGGDLGRYGPNVPRPMAGFYLQLPKGTLQTSIIVGAVFVSGIRSLTSRTGIRSVLRLRPPIFFAKIAIRACLSPSSKLVRIEQEEKTGKFEKWEFEGRWMLTKP